MAKAIQLPSGNWHIKVYDYTDKDEKRHYKAFTDPDKKMVEYLAAEFKLNKKRKSQVRNWTVGETIDAYISGKDGILSPTTIEGYKKFRKNNLQGLMPIMLKDLTREKVQNEVNEECKKISPRTKKPLSPKSIANYHGLLAAALNMYYPDFMLKTTLPAKKKRIIELPSPEDIMKMVVGTDIELPCVLAMWLSYSISEIRGIKISAISGDGYITIKEVVVDVEGKPVPKSATKAFDRTRKTKLPQYIMELIKKQESYIRFRETGVDEFLIAQSGKSIYHKFLRLQKEYGMPHTTLHQLRHINASVMLQLGVPDKYAMERGGWSTDYVMKSVYQHTYSDKRKSVDKEIDNYFEEIVKKVK